MNHIDLILLITITVIGLGGFLRGFGKEVLQFVLFAIGAILTAFVWDNGINIQSANDIGPTLKFLGTYSVGMYFTTFVISFVVQKMIFSKLKPSRTSRIAGLIFACTKIVVIVLAINLVYAIANPFADRFRTMPKLVQNSKIIHFSDNVTEQIYFKLAEWEIVTYKKYLEKEKTYEEIKQERMEKRMGIKTPKLW